MNDIRIRKTAKADSEFPVKNAGRRKFIKTLAYAGGALVVGGILARNKNLLALNKSESTGKELSNFRFVERGHEVALYDKSGDEILIVDKNSF